MEAGDILELSIETLSAGGDGLAFHAGKAVFVPFVAPGDRVNVRVVQEKPDYIRAELRSVLVPSGDRVEPPCPSYCGSGEAGADACGGCSLMHVSYPAQLAAKKRIVEEAFRRTGGLEGVSAEIEGGPAFGYRNRAQFHFTENRRPGYSKRLSSEILAVPGCPILVSGLRAWLEASALSDDAWKTLKPFMAGKDRFIAFGTEDRAYLEGPDGELTVSLLGLPVRFHLRGFFQSNLAMLERLIPAVCDGLSGDRAADLYCGVGLFGAFLKERFARLVCVEQDPRAVGYAWGNVGKMADYSASTMEEWTASPQARQRYDHVVVDPPRAGLAPQVRAWLSASKPESIGYVSCDPVSLARDAGELWKAGYEPIMVKAFDFYPQTAHIETYARFALR